MEEKGHWRELRGLASAKQSLSRSPPMLQLPESLTLRCQGLSYRAPWSSQGISQQSGASLLPQEQADALVCVEPLPCAMRPVEWLIGSPTWPREVSQGRGYSGP